MPLPWPSTRPRLLLVVIACFLATAARGWAEDGAAPANSDAALREVLLQRNQLCQDAAELANQEKLPEAIFALRQALQLHQQAGGAQTPEAYQILSQILMWQDRQADFSGALATANETAALAAQVFGADDWRTIDVKVAAATYQKAAGLNAADQQRLAAAERTDLDAMKLHDAGNDSAALEKAQQALKVRQELLGRDDMFTSGSLSSVGTYYKGTGAFAKAQPYLEESVAIRQRLYGPAHPSTSVSLNNLAALYSDMGDYQRAGPILEKVAANFRQQRGPDDPDTLQAIFNLGAFYVLQEKLSAAEEILVPLLQQQQGLFGDSDIRVARTMDCLGNLYIKKSNYAKARPLLTDCLEIYRHLGGDDHPFTADALSDLGELCEQTGDFNQARQYYQQALDIRRRVLGEAHPDTTAALGGLAHVNQATGDFARAERLYRQALETQLQTVGEQNAKTAKTLARIGAMYLGMHDFSKAAMYFQRALDADEKLLGDAHPDTAQAMVQLADAYKYLRRTDQAEQLYQKALATLRTSLGADHPQTAICMNSLAHLYETERKYDRAESLYRQSLAALEAKLGKNDPNPPLVLSQLARIAFLNGQYEKSQSMSKQAIERLDQSLSPNHPSLTEVLFVAGLTQLALNDATQAKALFNRALGVVDEQVDTNAAAQSERQQLVLASELRYMLDLFLSLPADQISTAEAYNRVLQWKGAVTARQLRDHQKRGDDSANLAAQLQETCTRLTVLSLKVPDPSAREAWLKAVYELKQRKESLESDLAFRGSESHAQQASTAAAAEQVQRALPPQTALVDVLESSYFWFAPEDGKPVLHHARRFLAFVVRNDRPIVRIDLGPSEPINDAVEAWRSGCRYAVDPAKQNPAMLLRQRFWEPLKPAIEGCNTVLFSPDGALSRIPLGVLPGDRPGSFLIEDVAIALVPVPQMLPEMLAAKPQANGNAGAEAPPSLLLVGDVDYDASPGQSDSKSGDQLPKDTYEGGELQSFSPLKSTGAEVQALSELFRSQFNDGRLTMLEKQEATEAAFRRCAPQSQWLLLATHGFFAPPGIGAALAVQDQLLGRENQSGFNCGFLSGLALAGANTPSSPDGDDGILTAFEVANLDLHTVNLAVLSGCETGLGQIAGGEGAVGLQRAFQVAGARTTVASLWNVPDQKTSLLMKRFFTNMWEKKLPKLEALREAQLWLMRTGGKQPDSDNAQATTATAPARQAPYYWAAFVLSGDWR